MLHSVGSSSRPQGPRPADAPKAMVAQSVALSPKAQAEGDEKPLPTSGFAKQALDILKDLGGDVNRFRKEHPFLAFMVAVTGFISGWKLDELAHRAIEKADGNNFNQNGQNAYLALKDNGHLLDAVKDEHTFFDNLKSLPAALFAGKSDAEKWKVFNTYTVLAELDRPTIGEYNGQANAPVVLIALASNKTADKTALTTLAAGIRTRINGTPAKQAYYQPVIDALQKTHGITV